MKKKLLSFGLACLMAFASASPVMATDYSGGTPASCLITVTVDSTYVVSIPATIALSPSAGNLAADITVGVKGNIDVTKKVSVAPSSASVTLTGTHDAGNTISVAVSQVTGNTAWSAAELNANTSAFVNKTNCSLSVSASGIAADAYEGTLTFNYGLANI